MPQENWKDIHEYFKHEPYQNFWKDRGFDYQTTKKWAEILGINFEVGDFAFCTWTRDEKHLTLYEVWDQNNAKSLKAEYQKIWTNIHQDFAKNSYGKTFLQRWEEEGLTHQSVKKWISIGFKPDNYQVVKQWKENFTVREVEEWIKIGFTPDDYEKIKSWKSQNFTFKQVKDWIGARIKSYEYNFANYLQKNNYTPQSLLQNNNIEELRDKYARETDDWVVIHEYLNKNEQNKWNQQNFTYEQVKEWKKSLKKGFRPNDYLFCDWLRDVKSLTPWELSAKCNRDELRKEYEIFWEKYQDKWKNQNFVYQEVKNWIKKGLTPCDHNFAYFLKKDGYQPSDLNENNLEELKRKVSWQDIREDFSFEKRVEWEEQVFSYQEAKEWVSIGFDLDKITEWKRQGFTSVQSREWTDIGFSHQDLQKIKPWRNNGFNAHSAKEWIDVEFKANEAKNWKDKNFNARQAQEWIKAGAKIDDHEFVAWLKTTKKETPQWITSYKEDYKILNERFKNYSLCSECNQPNTGEKWCKKCNSKRFKDEFESWTSQNQEIDKFIQKYQLIATDKDKFLEWIPYGEFVDIEYLDEGGFGKVYKAKWYKGSIHHWDDKKNQWYREKDHCEENKFLDFEDESDSEDEGTLKPSQGYKIVVLKRLNNSSANTEFLSETEKHKIIDDWFNNIVPCYGLSQDPKTKNYLMVMRYMKGGNLRKYLKNNKNLSLKDKLKGLVNIAQGLKDIHQKKLVHRDFHSGNILGEYEEWYNTYEKCFITDLGLCKPVNETSEKKIYGVLPYVAPEVLLGKSYTEKSDVYSFAVIAYEILSGIPPHYDQAHDKFLGEAICQGKRPQFQIKIPSLLKNLVWRCWDKNPQKRPTAYELEKTLRNWEKNIQFQNQLQEAEEYNQVLPEEIKNPNCKNNAHPKAIYTSRLLPTKEIIQLFESEKEIKNIEKETELTFENNTKKVMKDFIIANQKALKDLNNEIEKNVKELLESKLKEELEKAKFLEKVIKKIIRCCKKVKLVDLEEIDSRLWTNLYPSFTSELQNKWISLNFTYLQVQEWVNALGNSFNPAEYEFINWLTYAKNLTPEEVYHNLENLRSEFDEQSRMQIQTIHNPPRNS